MKQKTGPQALLQRMFEAAIAAAQPALCLPPQLPDAAALGGGRLTVLGAGKAAAAMARAVEEHWPGPLAGMVLTAYGHGVGCARVEVREAGHPLPDAAGMAAARRLLDLAASLGADDTALCLISGGGSALLALPLEGVTLEDKRRLTAALLKSGASIGEINCVRRHLSAIKGGRLAVACHPARVINLLISDVPGDRPADIGSGPGVGDASRCADALDVLRRYRLSAPAAVMALLESGRGESVKPGDPRLARVETRVIATPQRALAAAARVAAAAGYAAHILSDAIEGEAREVARVMAAIARQVALRGQPFSPPCVLLSGGETTVTVRGSGCGGRNVEFLLALGLALEGQEGLYALAGDTDGVDGQAAVAGALLGPDSLARALALGLSPRQCLEANDGHGFFAALGDGIVTGPTLTNVNDFRAILIQA